MHTHKSARLNHSETTGKEPFTSQKIERESGTTSTGWRQLPEPFKTELENRSGFDLGKVEVYDNSPLPDKLGAYACAYGLQIHLAPGQQDSLLHEAWHVIQQLQGRVKPTRWIASLPLNDDPGLEMEAWMEARMAEKKVATTSLPEATHPVRRPAHISVPVLQLNTKRKRGEGEDPQKTTKKRKKDKAPESKKRKAEDAEGPGPHPSAPGKKRKVPSISGVFSAWNMNHFSVNEKDGATCKSFNEYAEYIAKQHLPNFPIPGDLSVAHLKDNMPAVMDALSIASANKNLKASRTAIVKFYKVYTIIRLFEQNPGLLVMGLNEVNEGVWFLKRMIETVDGLDMDIGPLMLGSGGIGFNSLGGKQHEYYPIVYRTAKVDAAGYFTVDAKGEVHHAGGGENIELKMYQSEKSIHEGLAYDQQTFVFKNLHIKVGDGGKVTIESYDVVLLADGHEQHVKPDDPLRTSQRIASKLAADLTEAIHEESKHPGLDKGNKKTLRKALRSKMAQDKQHPSLAALKKGNHQVNISQLTYKGSVMKADGSGDVITWLHNAYVTDEEKSFRHLVVHEVRVNSQPLWFANVHTSPLGTEINRHEIFWGQVIAPLKELSLSAAKAEIPLLAGGDFYLSGYTSVFSEIQLWGEEANQVGKPVTVPEDYQLIIPGVGETGRNFRDTYNALMAEIDRLPNKGLSNAPEPVARLLGVKVDKVINAYRRYLTQFLLRDVAALGINFEHRVQKETQDRMRPIQGRIATNYKLSSHTKDTRLIHPGEGADDTRWKVQVADFFMISDRWGNAIEALPRWTGPMITLDDENFTHTKAFWTISDHLPVMLAATTDPNTSTVDLLKKFVATPNITFEAYDHIKRAVSLYIKSLYDQYLQPLLIPVTHDTKASNEANQMAYTAYVQWKSTQPSDFSTEETAKEYLEQVIHEIRDRFYLQEPVFEEDRWKSCLEEAEEELEVYKYWYGHSLKVLGSIALIPHLDPLSMRGLDGDETRDTRKKGAFLYLMAALHHHQLMDGEGETEEAIEKLLRGDKVNGLPEWIDTTFPPRILSENIQTYTGDYDGEDHGDAIRMLWENQQQARVGFEYLQIIKNKHTGKQPTERVAVYQLVGFYSEPDHMTYLYFNHEWYQCQAGHPQLIKKTQLPLDASGLFYYKKEEKVVFQADKTRYNPRLGELIDFLGEGTLSFTRKGGTANEKGDATNWGTFNLDIRPLEKKGKEREDSQPIPQEQWATMRDERLKKLVPSPDNHHSPWVLISQVNTLNTLIKNQILPKEGDAVRQLAHKGGARSLFFSESRETLLQLTNGEDQVATVTGLYDYLKQRHTCYCTGYEAGAFFNPLPKDLAGAVNSYWYDGTLRKVVFTSSNSNPKKPDYFHRLFIRTGTTPKKRDRHALLKQLLDITIESGLFVPSLVKDDRKSKQSIYKPEEKGRNEEIRMGYWSSYTGWFIVKRKHRGQKGYTGLKLAILNRYDEEFCKLEEKLQAPSTVVNNNSEEVEAERYEELPEIQYYGKKEANEHFIYALITKITSGDTVLYDPSEQVLAKTLVDHLEKSAEVDGETEEEDSPLNDQKKALKKLRETYEILVGNGGDTGSEEEESEENEDTDEWTPPLPEEKTWSEMDAYQEQNIANAPGRIRNLGSGKYTCFLDAVLQLMAAVPSYAYLFSEANEESLNEADSPLTQICKQGRTVLQCINTGEETPPVLLTVLVESLSQLPGWHEMRDARHFADVTELFGKLFVQNLHDPDHYPLTFDTSISVRRYAPDGHLSDEEAYTRKDETIYHLVDTYYTVGGWLNAKLALAEEDERREWQKRKELATEADWLEVPILDLISRYKTGKLMQDEQWEGYLPDRDELMNLPELWKLSQVTIAEGPETHVDEQPGGRIETFIRPLTSPKVLTIGLKRSLEVYEDVEVEAEIRFQGHSYLLIGFLVYRHEHYVTYVKRATDTWYLCDDLGGNKKLDTGQAIDAAKQAYMLTYVKSAAAIEEAVDRMKEVIQVIAPMESHPSDDDL